MTSIVLLVLSGCAAPPLDTFTQLTLAGDDTSEGAHARWISLIEGATTQLEVGLPAAEDLAVTDALIAAWERGVAVEVVSDVDRADDPGMRSLEEAGVPLRLGDGPVGYFDFSIEDDVAWESDQVHLTSAYVLVDRRDFLLATDGGRSGPGGRVTLTGFGEGLIEDLAAEHVQLFGGTDASELTDFDGMSKSIADNRWMYATSSDVVLELYFGPQERLTKRVIDAVYGARSSVRLLTDDLADEGLVAALVAKEQTGFAVEVTVGPAFGTATPLAAEQLRDSLPFLQIPAGVVPTVVLVDLEIARDGRYHHPKVIVLSQPLWSASRIVEGVETTTDQYADAIGWILTDHDEPSDELRAVEALVDRWRLAAEGP